MDPEFIAILKKLIAEQGKETLLNATKCKALLSDYTRNEYKKESRLLLQALDAGVQKVIDKAENIAICKLQQIRVLSEEYSLAEERATEVVDTLALILRGDKSRTEIQKEKPESAGKSRKLPLCNRGSLHPKKDAIPKIGSIIPFGSYKWRVLDARGGEALIITEDAIENRPYNEKYTAVTWKTCDLRKYLNNEFLKKFTKKQQGRIIETTNYNPNNLWYGTKGGNDTRDRVFLLSLEEADKYFGNSGDYLNKMRKGYEGGKYIADKNGFAFSNNHDRDRVAGYGSKACWWWLRSPGGSSYGAVHVYDDGIVYVNGNSVSYGLGGVRPALWLKV